MKKILLSSAALVGVAFAAAPAMAQVDVTVGGHTKNYLGWAKQDHAARPASDAKTFDMLRESELHFNAEGTADNGLTYGFHVEAEVDGGDGFAVEESYLYLSSSLGRVNLGSEDGANYLLQVAAPSADANVDGLRQYINPVNYSAAVLGGSPLAGLARVDYANDATAQAEKITYLSPNYAGFQFGVSYTPSVGNGNSVGTAGFAPKVVGGVGAPSLDDAYEGAVRYEGTFNNVGFAVGGGYTHVENKGRSPAVGVVNRQDDVAQWNLGTDLDIGAFGLGAVYTRTNNVGGFKDVDARTWVVGADYTTGPFQFGASYLNNDSEQQGNNASIDTDRYTGGVVYTVTQGLTLRGSISYIQHDVPGVGAVNKDIDATSVLGGIQFNF